MPDTTPDPAPGVDAESARDEGVVDEAVKYTPLSWDMVQAIFAGKLKAPIPEDFMGPAFPPTRPTMARPGSEQKIQVLAARYARRERLFHPKDAS